MANFKEKVLELHQKNKGKIDVLPNLKIDDLNTLSMAYTPGVALPCIEIQKDPEKANDYTIKGKVVAIVTDGSAVLGLGNIGPKAALPVMEGKAALLHQFSGVQAFPLALDTQDPDEIIRLVQMVSPNFAAIMLEDISAPNCVYIETVLQEKLDIPVFHDDQHGTAIVVSAGLINALKVVGKKINEIKVVVCGLGAAGSAIIKLLNKLGIKEIYGYDLMGVVKQEKYAHYNRVVKDLIDQKQLLCDEDANSLSDLIKDKDVFIGVSAKNILSKAMVSSMANDPIIFAMANPDPEILPDIALSAGAKIVGTGRSDYPNQINNVLVFPGLMKGVLKAKLRNITDDIKVTTAKAIANLVPDNALSANHILPNIFDKNVVKAIETSIYKIEKRLKNSL